MYSNFYLNTDAHDTGCLTFVKFSNSLFQSHPALYFDKQFVYKRGRFASYTGSQMTWCEIEHFCIAQGQQMVTVNNIEEQYELVQFAKSYLIQDGVPLGIWRDVGIRFKCVEINNKGSPMVIWISLTILHNFSVDNEIIQLDHKCYYSVLLIYRGRVYHGIGYIAVACWTPFFATQECDIFCEIAVTPWTQLAGDNFSRNLVTAIAFVSDSLETIFREINSGLPVNAGWNTCCAMVSQARWSIDTSIALQSRVRLVQCPCKSRQQIANLGINNAFLIK